MSRRIILFFSIIFCAVACTPSFNDLSEWMSDHGKVRVLSTTAMIGSLVSAVGGDDIAHLNLIVGDIDPHSYELVKGDGDKLQAADLIFYNGLGLEHGASLSSALTRHPDSHSLGASLQTKCPERLLYADGAVDPHIWMDVSLFIEVVDPIVATLSKALPDKASLFHARGETLKKELLHLDETVDQLIKSLPQERRYLITSHDAFNYFAKRYLSEQGELNWQERFSAPEGLAPDGQLSSHHIQRIIDHLKERHIAVIFPESNVSRDSLKKIVSSCQRSGIDVQIATHPLYGDALGPKGSDGDTYMKMVRANAQTIVEHLKEKEQ